MTMENILFYILVLVLASLVLWMGGIILEKAGLSAKWVFILLVPVVNIAMIWVFAFTRWPNIKPDVDQDLN